MTPEQYLELLNYINTNNGWNYDRMQENTCDRNRHAIKYVESLYDSREHIIYAITLRDITDESCQEITFFVDTSDGIEALYEYLDEPAHKK